MGNPARSCDGRLGYTGVARHRQGVSLYGTETVGTAVGEMSRHTCCSEWQASRRVACLTLNDIGIEAISCREQYEFTIRPERVAS
jgi:hypothetical protein